MSRSFSRRFAGFQSASVRLLCSRIGRNANSHAGSKTGERGCLKSDLSSVKRADSLADPKASPRCYFAPCAWSLEK
jgi:hypothetical protein